MHNRVPTTYTPKITVKPQNSLYQLSYSEIPPPNDVYNGVQLVSHEFKAFNIYFYVDIPTIDYYMDELKDSKLSRFNRKFKLNLLKDSIWSAFTNGNQEFWDTIRQANQDRDRDKDENKNKNKICCNLNIRTSGSLRYVGTIKFLMESIYKEVLDPKTLKISLTVSDLTYKWFKTFLDRELLEANVVTFLRIKNVVFKSKTGENSDHTSGVLPYPMENPFKEYFRRLHAKFTHKNDGNISRSQLESIVIVTNSTGIKALLTILSDKPLTNFISEESINELYNHTLSSSNLNNRCGSYPGSSENVSSLNEHNGTTSSISRESSSLLSFQNIALTSNKDRSVRIRSRSLTNKRVTNTNILNRSFSNDNTNNATTNISNNSTAENLEVWYEEHGATAGNEPYAISQGNEIDIDMDEDDDSSEYGINSEEDGISFYVPSLLSRTPSASNVRNGNSLEEMPVAFPSTPQPTVTTDTNKTRVRSLSLMDPDLKHSFVQRTSTTTMNNNNNTNVHNTNNNPNYLTIPKEQSSRSYNNICIHDGDFNDFSSPRKTRHRKLSIGRGNSLIPPELYSRISSPTGSSSNSSTSLPYLNYTPSIDIVMCDVDDSTKIPTTNTIPSSYNGATSGDSTLRRSHSPLIPEKNFIGEPQQREYQKTNYFFDLIAKLGQQKGGMQRPFGLCFNNYDYDYLKSGSLGIRNKGSSDAESGMHSSECFCEDGDGEIHNRMLASRTGVSSNSSGSESSISSSGAATVTTIVSGIDSREHSTSSEENSDLSITGHSAGINNSASRSSSSSSSVVSTSGDLGLSLHLDLYGNKDSHMPRIGTPSPLGHENHSTEGDSHQTTIRSPKVPFRKIPSINLYGDGDFSTTFGAGGTASTNNTGRSAWVLGGNVL